MDAFPISLLKEKEPPAKISSPKQTCDKQKMKQMWEGGTTRSKGWHAGGKLGGGGKHGDKVATWHGQ